MLIVLGLGMVVGPFAIPLLIASVVFGRWGLWAAGSGLPFLGAMGWGVGGQQFVSFGSFLEAEAFYHRFLMGAAIAIGICAALVRLRQRRRARLNI